MKTRYIFLLMFIGISVTSCFLKENKSSSAEHKYNGIDVSHYQGVIEWDKVAQDKNIEFVYVKATEGATHLDSRYYTNFEGARLNGLKVGRYGKRAPIINGQSESHYYIWQFSESGKIEGVTKSVGLCRFHKEASIQGILYSHEMIKGSKCNPADIENIVIEETHGLCVYYPKYKTVDLVCGTMPSANDKGVLMCCEAAYTGELLSEFKHSNIAGNHVSGGKYYKGYSCKANTGCFVYFADTKTWDFAIGDYNNQLRLAEQRNGCGFGQVMLIHDGKRQPKNAQKNTSSNYYRVLAEFNGKLCIIDSKDVMNYNDYVNSLLDIGVKHALYLDMGTGWNYSYYRGNNGRVYFIHDKRIPYTTNWLTFYK